MKRFIYIILFSAILFMAINPAQAQLVLKKGVKGGINFSSLSSNTDVDYSSLTGSTFGGYLKLNLPVISFEANVLYTQKGAQFSSMGTDYDIRVNYLEIPLLVKYHSFIFPLVAYNFHAGPAFAFKLGEDVESQTDGNVFKGSDVGIAMGAGITFTALISEVSIEGRYVLGLNNVSDVGGDSEFKNRSFMILVGVGF
jgi:hypothetical protein